MHDSSDPEVELYEEIVGDLNWSPPVSFQSLSIVTDVSAASVRTTFHDPTINLSRRPTVETTDMFAHAPRPDPRYPELPEALEEPWYGVAATVQAGDNRLSR